MNNCFTKTYRFLLALAFLLMSVSCADTIGNIFNSGEIETGEKIQFTTMVPDVAMTSRSAYSEWKSQVESYKAVNREYSFNIEMYKNGDSNSKGTAVYKPSSFTDETFTNTAATHDGTLVPESNETNSILYWQDNVNEWGFRSTSKSSSSIEPDQSDQTKWLYQDLLLGYSYLPIWDGEVGGDGHGKDNFDAINYRTSKQWYADNKTAQQLSGLMVEEENSEAFKKVPLYMKHQRSWITIFLKAGDGVGRDKLAFANSHNNINTSIYSYANGTTTEVTSPWRNEAFVEYGNDKNGPADLNASTTRYDAIVMPHDYTAKAESDIIARINVSNQNFTFSASSDFEYTKSTQNDAEAIKHMENYKLEPGKHLTITATLSRASRMVLITAWVEDWTESVTTTLCDDYGQKGDPVVIPTKAKLLEFLTSDKNKAGYVGIISGNQLDLDTDGDWNYDGDLNATLNVAGAKLLTKNRIFNNISTSGSLINGEIIVKDNASPRSVVADSNSGMIERVSIKTESNHSNAKATVAGFVEDNHGTIYQCSTNLNVLGANGTEFVGGIAAKSDYVSASDKTIMPVIDDCTVDARVDGVDGVKGGGIVGYANGRVSNCTFEYGITLSQLTKTTGSDFNFKNIFHSAAAETRAYNNSWPTKATNPVPATTSTTETLNENMYSHQYDQVIDCQNELETLLTSTYNIKNKEYRISADFTVDDSWNHAQNSGDAVDIHTFSGDYNNGNMQFNLFGNSKTITLAGSSTPKTVSRWSGDAPNVGTKEERNTGSMLFTNIHGKIYDLTLDLAEDLISQPTTGEGGKYSAADAMAPLGYSVYGPDALLNNIRVISTTNKAVESSTPGGLVVWAYNGAKIENCYVNIKVDMWLPSEMGTQGRHYAGGVVACAAEATLTGCQYQYEGTTLSGITNTAKTGKNFFYGGIIGGTSIKTVSGKNHIPSLVLNDNSSWYSTPSTNNERFGSIIGFACYISLDDNNTILNGMAENNEGNWWNTNSKGAGYCAQKITEVQAIGKRNSKTPDKK